MDPVKIVYSGQREILSYVASIFGATPDKYGFNIPDEIGSGRIEYFEYDDDFSWYLENANFTRPIQYHLKARPNKDEFLVLFYYSKHSLKTSSIRQKIDSKYNNCIWFLSGNVDVIVETPPLKSSKTVSAFISKRWIEKHLSTILKDSEFFRHCIYSKDPILLMEMLTEDHKTALNRISMPPVADHMHIEYVHAKISEMLTLFFDSLSQSRKKTQTESSPIALEDQEKIKGLLQHVSDNMIESYSMDDVSQLAGISKTKLQQVFHHIFGKSVFQHILEMKMTRAKDLLTDPSNSISAVAHDSGYSDIAHFSKNFKKFFDISPSEFRKVSG